MLQGIIVTILSLTAIHKGEQRSAFFKIEENHFLHDGNTIWTGKVTSLMCCSQMCVRQAACRSANFMRSHGTCSIFGQKQTAPTEKLLPRQGSFYLEKVCY